jgi:hypothetical protein
LPAKLSIKVKIAGTARAKVQGDKHKKTDQIIDFGPAGGNAGGCIMAAGSPEDVALVKESWTGRSLRHKLAPVK